LFKKILVALDGSKAANNALKFAVDLSEATLADLELLTVVPSVFLPSHSIHVLNSEAISDCAKALDVSFKGVLDKAEGEVKRRKPKFKLSTKFEKGEPAEKIVETAERGNVDLIVMGSRGLGGRVSTLGSVSSRVVDNSSCPVIIVK
jgi:nucleotide-binding universal stress UspA family protein